MPTPLHPHDAAASALPLAAFRRDRGARTIFLIRRDLDATVAALGRIDSDLARSPEDGEDFWGDAETYTAWRHRAVRKKIALQSDATRLKAELAAAVRAAEIRGRSADAGPVDPACPRSLLAAVLAAAREIHRGRREADAKAAPMSPAHAALFALADVHLREHAPLEMRDLEDAS